MTVYLLRVQSTSEYRIWIACNENATAIVRTRGTRNDAIWMLEQKAREKVEKVVRHKGVMSRSEAAMVLSDHKMGRVGEKPG